MARAFNLIIKEGHWNLDVDTGAIASFAVRIYSTTVPDRLQRSNTRFNHCPRACAVDRNHKANAT